MFDDFINRKVVIDLSSPYVCLGTLKAIGERFIELANADLHDLRDTPTPREHYVVAARQTGIKRNRKKLFVAWAEVVAIALLEDVVAE